MQTSPPLVLASWQDAKIFWCCIIFSELEVTVHCIWEFDHCSATCIYNPIRRPPVFFWISCSVQFSRDRLPRSSLPYSCILFCAFLNSDKNSWDPLAFNHSHSLLTDTSGDFTMQDGICISYRSKTGQSGSQDGHLQYLASLLVSSCCRYGFYTIFNLYSTILRGRNTSRSDYRIVLLKIIERLKLPKTNIIWPICSCHNPLKESLIYWIAENISLKEIHY